MVEEGAAPAFANKLNGAPEQTEGMLDVATTPVGFGFTVNCLVVTDVHGPGLVTVTV